MSTNLAVNPPRFSAYSVRYVTFQGKQRELSGEAHFEKSLRNPIRSPTSQGKLRGCRVGIVGYRGSRMGLGQMNVIFFFICASQTRGT
jgi:hypothetical protein